MVETHYPSQIFQTKTKKKRSLFRSYGRQSFKLFSQDTELQVNMIALVGRWSGKCHALVTLGKTLHCKFIVQVPRRQTFEPFFQEMELQALLPGDGALSLCDSFSGKVVLKRPFVSDPGKPQLGTFIVQVSWETGSNHSPRRQSFKLIQ